jgi:uncharacterized protein (DUF4415 family)
MIVGTSIAALWWEEYNCVEDSLAERKLKYNRMFESCLHHNDELCYVAHIQMHISAIELPLEPVLRDSLRNYSRAKNIIDKIMFEAHVRNNTDLALKTLLSLPRDFRIHYVSNLHEPLRTWIRQMLGDEVLELLKKSRVEIKIVLDVEDAVKLIRKYGKEWRERARELLRKALETSQSGSQASEA